MDYPGLILRSDPFSLRARSMERCLFGKRTIIMLNKRAGVKSRSIHYTLPAVRTLSTNLSSVEDELNED